MTPFHIGAWVAVLVASIVGLAAKDWRWYGIPLAAGLLVLLLHLFAR